MLTNKDIFSDIYRNEVWSHGNPTIPLSGPGSSVEYTENLRAKLPYILKTFNVKTLLDAGCGDLTWMSLLVNDLDIKYIGVDVVESLIEKHWTDFPDIEFHVKDITTDSLPSVDMMLCRDCLFHMSYNDLFKTLHNFVNSHISFLFTTTHITRDFNFDIATGGFRLLNLMSEPFNFPEPLYSMYDSYAHHPPRNMAIWSRDQVISALVGSHYE
jgi:hypothetical protein